MEVLRKDSDTRLRYYMFKRLNTGGAILSDQEVRNCTIRLLSSTFNDFIIELSKNQDFRNCVANLSEEYQHQKFDQELILRFFAFKNKIDLYRHDVSDFLTDYMESVSGVDDKEILFDYFLERELFNKTFAILYKTLGEKIFCRKNKKLEYLNTFLVYHYEAFTLGIQPYILQINSDDDFIITKVRNAFDEVKNSEEFKIMTTGGGKSYRNALIARIEFVSKLLGDALQ